MKAAVPKLTAGIFPLEGEEGALSPSLFMVREAAGRGGEETVRQRKGASETGHLALEPRGRLSLAAAGGVTGHHGGPRPTSFPPPGSSCVQAQLGAHSLTRYTNVILLSAEYQRQHD